MIIKIQVEYPLHSTYPIWAGGIQDYMNHLAEAVASVPEAVDFLSSTTNMVELPTRLKHLGWGWIPPDPSEYDDPDWDSPGLVWDWGPGEIKILREG